MCPELVDGQSVAMCPELVEWQAMANLPLSLSTGTDTDRLLLLPALTVWRRPRRRQGQALRVALRTLRASLDPSSGRRV
jgi:hypothetical protein